MERLFTSWLLSGGTRFDEDGPEARDRRHLAAWREARAKRPNGRLADIRARFFEPQPASPAMSTCCAAG